MRVIPSSAASRELPRKVMRLARVVAALAALGTAGCASARDPARPAAALASSPDAQRRFRPLRRAWATGERDARAALRAPLEALVGAYPRDDVARAARAYLAWIAMEAGDLPGARARVAELGAGPAGTARDLAA
jgi:hypothetical protein